MRRVGVLLSDTIFVLHELEESGVNGILRTLGSVRQGAGDRDRGRPPEFGVVGVLGSLFFGSRAGVASPSCWASSRCRIASMVSLCGGYGFARCLAVRARFKVGR